MLGVRTLSLVAAGTLSAGVTAVVGGVGTGRPVAVPPTVVVPVTVTTPAAAPVAPTPAGPVIAPSTELATPIGTIAMATVPGGPTTGTVGDWYGYHLTMPVIAHATSASGEPWIEVRLPWRPNESTGWVRAFETTSSTTPWELVVNLATARLTAYQHGSAVTSFPVGVGAPATPTPTGDYYVAVHEAGTPEPGFGPVVFDLSAHSEAIKSWDGSGDAIIAIHGPVTSAAATRIGDGDAHLSNGCVRVRPTELAELAQVPVGTPVEIIAG